MADFSSHNGSTAIGDLVADVIGAVPTLPAEAALIKKSGAVVCRRRPWAR